MLTKLETRINLEMSGDTKRYLVSAKQGDKATRRIIARLMNDGSAYTIPTGARVVMNVKKPDGKRVYNTCSFSGSDVTVELTNQTLAACGTAYCDIEVRTSDNTELITSASFTIEIEESMRSDDAILSSNEFTELENRIAGHIQSLNNTEQQVARAEAARVTAENARVTAENARAAAEQARNQNETTRIQQENERQRNTSQAIQNANAATTAAVEATTACSEVTQRAENTLQNQEQLEATLNAAGQIKQDVQQMQTAVSQAKAAVEQDKADIEETIQNSLLASAEQILASVNGYLERAEALYNSMYFDCDGETPALRMMSPIFIDGATPAVRNTDIGVDFDGGTPTSRLLAS